MKFTVIIPARYASSRLPAKPLADIHGKPMIVRVMEQAKKSGATNVIIATDHQQVFDVVSGYGGEVILTSDKHNSGTERLAEVINYYQLADDEVIVNVQGDEPLIPPVIIDQVAENLVKYKTGMATLAVPIESASEAFNPGAVKVVTDKDGYALYFSRATIPWERDRFAQIATDVNRQSIGDFYLRHIGIYAYRAGFIRQYINWAPSSLEQIEMLEQLRVLWYGEKIHVAVAKQAPAIGVDTQEDLDKVRALFKE
ncbi:MULTISPECIES: 3-deoxy-manno-octulosonate cytidylyltransferase [unclassified Gilliamella]|uniref:3-deoxy-manno-octulosonate cytidylyltransferase n=1 Tax=unclassified Gilliamella TaxID=2685620 RepID=UPI00226ADFE5|nr:MULTISPECIES: 3-deoxy-manno-octulosonate cytidylyltransferase [unclassified Gilliamella]MCX8600916.1 3-deoxy-manno-octulosonate cytidylyltransferase [Gilliamella sp. B3722]MCX8607555.1 3-deoxy-manno-octulosonate cytidylyltransferase [Gilliamella sp. B3771]MCX8610138.1 3-deoxy-manno-octulosonate cytidylyltransferase [Gilliamella sp. B3891]MCX8612602.1 3-deoxy-manno-octulosonate cytidylyltransferase [Gilliamella sp. B3773]MCX8616232.1 3-deoxy-manno-octulosonate cytidylyltransferase [Gilliamel